MPEVEQTILMSPKVWGRPFIGLNFDKGTERYLPASQVEELADQVLAFLAAFDHAARVDGTEEDWAATYRLEASLHAALAAFKGETDAQ